MPGHNAIAGDYRGIDAVLAYFTRRRELAKRTFRLHPRDVLVGDGDDVAIVTDGTAVIGGIKRGWSTIGLYRIREEKIAACWLLPLDADAFDAIWTGHRWHLLGQSSTRPTPSSPKRSNSTTPTRRGRLVEGHVACPVHAR